MIASARISSSDSMQSMLRDEPTLGVRALQSSSPARCRVVAIGICASQACLSVRQWSILHIKSDWPSRRLDRPAEYLDAGCVSSNPLRTSAAIFCQKVFRGPKLQCAPKPSGPLHAGSEA